MDSLSGNRRTQGKSSCCGAAPARLAAYRALRRVTKTVAADSSEALNQAIGELGLDERDARLATALTLGVLRHHLFLMHQVRRFVNRKPSPETALLLQMVAAQRFLLERIPPHAAVDDAVRLAAGELRLSRHETGFVNAVARRIMAAPGPDLPPPEDRDGYLTTKFSVPPTLLQITRERFGEAVLEDVLEAMNREPPLTLRANRLRTTREDLSAMLADLGVQTHPGQYAPDALIVQDPAALPSLLRSAPWEAGLFYVQDEASQLVAVVAAPQPGERVLDLCAAPGGKCLHAAEITAGQAVVTATDVSPQRLELLQVNAQRLGTPGLDLRPPNSLPDGQWFDLVLVDAPCSGIGTVRRHPEIKLRVGRAGRRSLQHHQQRQIQLLCRAADMTAPGGRIVYSTCSFAREENAEAVAKFLEVRRDFEVARNWPLPAALIPLRDPDGFLRTWPTALTLDGFEMCVLTHRTHRS
jgi:16S rRNA (cytosine967-C5)-methyltransferase